MWTSHARRGGWKGQSQHSMSAIGRIVNYRSNPRILNRKESSITGPSRKRCTFHLLQEIDDPCNPDNPLILAFLQWTFLQNNLSELPPSLP